MGSVNALAKSDFPLLRRSVNGQRLCYLDSAATTPMPQAIGEKLQTFYAQSYSSVHRSVNSLGLETTNAYEHARSNVAKFINADPAEVIFTSGATASLNLVAESWGRENIHQGDEIVLAVSEHHSNFLPWQQLAQAVGAKLRLIKLNDQEELDLVQAKSLFNEKTKLLALAQVSNVLGSENPVAELISMAHQVGAICVIDGAQAIPHERIDVRQMDCDFYAFSGHKMLGPTGIGVLYGKKALLEQMPPAHFGGGMINYLDHDQATWEAVPEKFEAGTPNTVGAIGLGYAIDYLNKIGFKNIEQHNQELMNYLLPKLAANPGVKIYGQGQKLGVVSFNLAGIHPHDAATLFDQFGVEVRAGHHCALPLMQELGIPASIRASFYIYNDQADCDRLLEAIKQTQEFFNESC